MSTMITFAANNEFFRKRKRVHRACESCKKRRKRCSHTFDDDEADAGSSSKSGQTANHAAAEPHPSSQNYDQRSQRGDERPDGSLSTMAPYSPTDDPPAQTPPNFLGYLNPEAVLREHVYSEKGKVIHSPVIPSIGQWIEGENPALRRPSTSQPGVPPSRIDDTSPTATQDVKVQRALRQYLEAVGVSILPPRQCQDGLLDIYFNLIHPLLPLVDHDVFSERYRHGTAPPLLMQAICIVASKHADAASYLCLGDDPRKMGPREFSHRLYNAVIAGIEAKTERNRVVLIQVLALISLHCEGPDGAEQASMHLAQAIHHAHTFGLQFGHQWKNQKSDDEENLEDLFWCLWSLDKINACMNGRPLLMHERDNSLTKLPMDPEKRSSPFGVWLQISEMLDKVIDYYRPGSKSEETGWEGDDFLGFEEMVGDGEDKLDGPIMSLLSLFHHTMCMASHKSLSINAPVKSTPSYVRQSLSATRVIHLLNAEAPERLPPLPLVPYALSVALSVVYRHFRSRRLKVHINRATEELGQCVHLLNRLRYAWWSAGTMADLGTAVLNNADRNTRTANTPATLSDHPHPLPHPNAKTETQPRTHHLSNWQPLDNPNGPPIDPRLTPQSQSSNQNQPQTHAPTPPSAPTPMTHLLNPLPPPPTPGQHPTSSERASHHHSHSHTATSHSHSHSHASQQNQYQNQNQNHHHGIGSAAATATATATGTAASFDFEASPDWLNFDTAFENFEGLLGSSGADLSNELFRPLNYEGLEGFLEGGGGNV